MEKKSCYNPAMSDVTRTTIEELGWLDGQRMREYGNADAPKLIVLHGGPAASGSASSLAQPLSSDFHVFEPWQRPSGEKPLSVARHIADLNALVDHLGAPIRLIGESWGAMLALAYAAEYRSKVTHVGAIACGTFDPKSRSEFKRLLAERVDQDAIDALEKEDLDPVLKMQRKYELILPAYDFDAEPAGDLSLDEPFDKQAHGESWDDMIRLQEAGTYPAAFKAITAPTAMFHGDFDPHPGRMIRDSLSPHIPHLEYFSYAEGGHSLQRERRVNARFFSDLAAWLQK